MARFMHGPHAQEEFMKKILTLGTLLLGCCLIAFAQTGSSQNQTPQGAAPSAYPQVQTPSEQAAPANPAAMPPDTSAAGQAPSRRRHNGSHLADRHGTGMPEPVGRRIYAGRQL